MKRTGFRKLTYKEALEKRKAKISRLRASTIAQEPHKHLKVTPKRRKKTDRQKAEEKIWELCKAIIRKKYPNVCYTCGAHGLEGSNWHTGHGKPKGALQLRFKYDLRNLKPQCMRDNKNLGGLQDIFIAKLEREEEGLEFLKEACVKIDGRWEIRRDIPTMGGTDALIFLNEKIAEYTQILESMV